MQYMFPYKRVRPNSRIVLYGAGVVGRDFFLQIRCSGYCELVAWTDRRLDRLNVQSPFLHRKDISLLSYDYVIVAVADKDLSDEIVAELIESTVPPEKIIWSRTYFISEALLTDRIELFNENYLFYMELLDKAMEEESEYIGDSFYQSYDALGIRGKRNIKERIRRYKLQEYLGRQDKVLNIGCNCGFFDCQIARLVSSITAVDVNGNLIDIARYVALFTHINNVEFVMSDAFGEDFVWETYDAIFCMAVYAYIMRKGIDISEFGGRILSHLKKDGRLFLESHPLVSKNFETEFEDVCDWFEAAGMEKCEDICITDGGERRFVILRKGVSCEKIDDTTGK